ncbi:maleylpyruvate isomerase family mycothiol-dependent enzyme [Nocardioides coralli]|uniref:maleylpyruvate isomerase family mycothiol-dependent enzyme n=1 Tax=Nocardioides coralli TaxID=2872154 RepID=UPI001CA43371|nr:maleylpyruvate isomerase family mycothiol-dependent enzyme [Nocardioides coralli]QZY30370.1 maleylpyruvate isomerase family mycothiol-dependent enzyme [Nocardioides coralli]
MDTFDLVAERRRALADALEPLDDAQWRTPSLCEGWEVRHVAGHLQIPWALSTPRLIWAMLRHRGYDAANLRLSRELGERPPATLVAGLREHADNRRTGPGMPPESLLADVVVHTADMLVPLGMTTSAPPETVARILDFVMSSKGSSLHPPGGVDGLRFEATDAPWSHGDGPEVTGEGSILAAALTGRAGVLDQLGGAGLPTFRQRFE